MAVKPGKLFYKIGEVSRLAQVEPYILRYWENEFPTLSPRKSGGGQRVYQQKDLDLVLSIKRMLHEEGYTIAGARKKISEGGRGAKGAEYRGAREAVEKGPEQAKSASGTVEREPEPLDLGIVAESRPAPKPLPRKIKKTPQMPLPFFGTDDKTQLSSALGKFKAEIKEIIELVK